jgi:PAS domain-containing protein
MKISARLMAVSAAAWIDCDERLVLSNTDFRRLYRLDEAQAAPGARFEDVVRSRVQRGFVPEAGGREEAWIAERVAQHRGDGGSSRSFLRQMRGGSWRRITEQRLPDGSNLGFSIDVTELVESQRALEAARHDAERARALLHEAVEAMPAAVEVYDAGDRLVLFNQRMLQIYPHMRDQPTLLGETFDVLVRRALAQGAVPEAIGRESQWLADRPRERGRRADPRLQRGPGGQWHHIYETPMPGGGLVAVRLDATEIVQQRDELRAAHERGGRTCGARRRDRVAARRLRAVRPRRPPAAVQPALPRPVPAAAWPACAPM